MKYLTKNLGEDETIIYEGSIHIFYTYFYGIMLVIGITAWIYFLLNPVMLIKELNFPNPVYILFMLIGTFLLIVFLRRFFKLFSTEIILTNKRFLYKSGLLSINTFEIGNDKIESINIEQDILERIIGAGSVIVTGIGGKSQSIKSVCSPLELRNSINKCTM